MKQMQTRKDVTTRQSRFAEAFMKTRNKTKAAILAGYSPKNAAQSGRQAAIALAEKAPEVMARIGLTLDRVIEKHLVPLLHATEMKFAQNKGEFTDYVEVGALGIRLCATRMALELLGAFPREDPVLASKKTVDFIIMDMPRPQRPEIDVTPTNRKK